MLEPYEFIKGYIPIKSALKTRFEGDILVAANKNSEVFYLNSIAGEIWNKIDGEKRIYEICGEILSEYDAESEQVHSDVVDLIRDFQWKKLIRLKEGEYNEKI
ncbi:MAG: PqqD family protein [Synergistaceae bacterium]|nr:PqqD family protein [Synergistaceae bacterium]